MQDEERDVEKIKDRISTERFKDLWILTLKKKWARNSNILKVN